MSISIKQLSQFLRVSGLFVIVLVTTTGVAMACPSVLPPNPFRARIELPPNPFRDQGIIRFFGLTARTDTKEGDSCGIALHTPSGVTVTAIAVNNAVSGEPVNFLGFEADPTASNKLCDERIWLVRNRQECTAFVSKVGPGGLSPNTPFEIVLEFSLDPRKSKDFVEFLPDRTRNWTRNRTRSVSMVKIANALARSATLITTGLDSFGNLVRHLSVFRPQQVAVCLGPVNPVTGLTTCEESGITAR